MKWYSVKKYIPATYNEVICRVTDNDGGEQILSAYYSHRRKEWYFNSRPTISVKKKHQYTVTHFSVIDPIEIEG